MNWKHLRHCSWLDTKARFVDSLPLGGALLDIASRLNRLGWSGFMLAERLGDE